MNNLAKTTFLTVLAFALFGALQAAPPGKFPPHGRYTAGTVKSISGMKKGDQYAVVCNECKTLTIKTVGDPKEAAALCHDGGKVHCDSCEEDRVVKRTGPPGKGRVTWVDKHGKECMLIIPLKEKE